VAGIEKPLPLHGIPEFAEGEPLLPPPGRMQAVIADYAATGLSLRAHPLALIRPALPADCLSAAQLWQQPHGAHVYTAGLVITRQRPGSANNVTFVTLEDESGFINLVVWERLAERHRQVLLNSAFMGVYGEIQKQDGVLHVIVRRMDDRTPLLRELAVSSRDFY